MYSLSGLSPLGFATPQSKNFGNFTITEVTDRAMASVTARKGEEVFVQKALSNILNQPAPGVGCHVAGKIGAFWIGQNQWMLSAPFDTHGDIVDAFLNKFRGKASLTEQTDGWCRFTVEGVELNRLCSLLCNVDTRDFLSGKAARTSIEHIGCFLLRLDTTVIEVLGPRSNAESLHHAIAVAAHSVAF